MTRYPEMSRSHAEAALQEFLAERPAALRHLQEVADGVVPLDGSAESLRALWPWVRLRLDQRAVGAARPQPAPTWSRYWLGDQERLSSQSLRLLDGVISYVADVLRAAQPGSTWVVADDPHPRFLHRNQPALRLGAWEQPVPTLVANLGRRVLSDWPPTDDRLVDVVESWLAGMREHGTPWTTEATGPPFEVTDLRGEEGDDFDFEVVLDVELVRDDVTTVDSLREALAREQGIAEAHAEDREVLLVRAPGWDADGLRRWVAGQLAGS